MLERKAREYEILRRPDEPDETFRLRVAEAMQASREDPFFIAQVMTGLPEDVVEEAAMAIVMPLMHDQRATLKAQNDTYFNTTWEELNDILIGNRLEKILGYDFTSDSDMLPSTFDLWVNLDKGLLIRAESYNWGRGDVRVNGLELQYELAIPEGDLDLVQRSNLNELESASSLSWIYDGDDHLATIINNRDMRSGLVAYLQALDNSGFQTNNPWKYFSLNNVGFNPDNHAPFIFLDRNEIHQASTKSEYRELVRKKLERLPEDVQKMLGYKA